MNTDTTIKILVDNNAHASLKKEHGLSIWIEAFGRRILFDTGQGKALIPNSVNLGCDLSVVDMLILSHGHYDHCGAISKVIRCNSSVQVYYHPDALVQRYSIHAGSGPQEISIPASEREALLDVPRGRVHPVNSPEKICADIGITGSIPRVHPLEDAGGPFFLDRNGEQPDCIKDDICIWINTPRGLIIITGCSHSGIINTVEYARRISGTNRILGIIGGFHLLQASHIRLETTCAAFKKWNPDFVIPCHCTGEAATKLLETQLKGKVFPGYAGLIQKIENTILNNKDS